MKLRPFWEVASRTATPSIFCNYKIRYCVYKSSPSVPILSQINLLLTIPSCPRSTLILSTDLCLRLPNGHFSSSFPISVLRIYAFLFPNSFYMHCLDDSDYSWPRVKVYALHIMQFSPTFCHLISILPKYSLQHPVLRHPQSIFLPLLSKTEFRTHTKPRQNYNPVYSKLYVLRQQTRRQKVFNLLLISSWFKFRLVNIVEEYLNWNTFSNYVYAIFMSWFWPAFLSQDSNIYFLSMSVSKSTFLLRLINISVFLFTVSMLSPCRFTSSA
jgi:hypothetical protein